MKLNKKDLKKIQYDFNSYSNRLLQADFQDYSETLNKFLNFLDRTPIIIEYVRDCGTCEWNLDDDVKEVQSSYGRVIFSTGETEEEEVRNIYAVLKYLVEKKDPICYGVAMGYSSSNKYQDKIKGFNDRFVMILINHIERYLTKVGIDMGLDEKVVYNVTTKNGQVIIANDNSEVTANNTVGCDADELGDIIRKLKANVSSLSEPDRETVAECVEVIETEVASTKPKKSMLKIAVNTIKGLKGATEFAAAAAALYEYIMPLIR